MNKLDILATACQLMYTCNKAHHSTFGIFIDFILDHDNECISFDILISNMEHATQLCGLLNLTLQVVVNTDPQSDKTLNFYIN